MKKAFLLIFSVVFAAFASAEERHQSYISYDDGGTVVKSGEDGRELDAHRNLPIYPGDEIVTARRGRSEIRLSDGNILGIDRTTALLLRSILDSYEGDANETVVELRYGKVAIHRTDLGREHVRLDTDNASYVAEHEGLYSVETDARGRDRVTVFDGNVEVRTPTRATRLRSGESATIDTDGVFDLAGDQRDSADDFERWFLKRAERFGSFNSRYVDRRLGYWTDDLDEYGRWVMVSGIGWSWRPMVSVGWRPYYHGYWHHSRAGSLTWVSYDPWGWGPYHYGRWAFDSGYGWVWVPGHGYSPAWVYWMYGSGYVGWAPSGWWDCYRPYYGWAYNRHHGWARPGFGWYGRVRTNDFDLRPWTFVDSGVLVSNRIDHAALKTDLIKQRLSRNPDGYATVSGGASRMTRNELRDPAEAIRRRGLDGRLTGRETGAPPSEVDVTPFIRRDPEVGGTIRDRIVRGRDGSSTVVGGATGPARTVGGLAPIGRGSVAPIGGGSVAPIGGGSGRVSRGGTTTPAEPAGSGGSTERDRGSWRDRVDRGNDRPATQPTPAVTPSTPDKAEPRPARDNSWRSRIRNDEETSRPVDRGSTGSSTSTSGDVPRRVIDGIGGARVVPRDTDGSSDRDRASSTRDRSSGSRDSGSRERTSSRDKSNGSSGSRESARPSPPPSNSGGSSSSGSSKSSGSSSSNRESGGRIKRDR
ncbi:MAG: FecR family protein [Acidobacteriota bacterium]|nr:FecR family protein [Acidobacteriota bacterium]